jgi:hypothetical protein
MRETATLFVLENNGMWCGVDYESKQSSLIGALLFVAQLE